MDALSHRQNLALNVITVYINLIEKNKKIKDHLDLINLFRLKK